MDLSISNFKDLMEGIQSLALTLAALCGAIWALFTFNVLRLRQKALVDLEKLQAELRHPKQQAVVDIELDVSQAVISGDSALYVSVAVTLKNVGNRNTHLKTNCSPVSATQVVWNEGSQEEGRSYAHIAPFNYVLRVGNSNVFPFILQVDDVGLYRVAFRVDLSADELGIAREAGQQGEKIYWATERLFIAKPLGENG